MNTCPICDSKSGHEILDWKKFKINGCKNCRLIYTTPLPSDEELNSFYQGFLFNKPEIHEIEKVIKTRKKELRRLFNLPLANDGEKKITFLDYGAGTGGAYKAAKELGLTSYYHDLDKQAMDFTKENFELTSEYIVEDIDRCEMKFDLIFSDNVIEHAKDPLQFIDKLMDQLENGGSLVIKTPHTRNTEMLFNPVISVQGYLIPSLKYNGLFKSMKAYLMRFWHCDPPRHIYSFSKNSFSYLMRKSKHKVEEFEISYYEMPWFKNTITKKFFLRRSKEFSVKKIIVRLLIWPIIPVEFALQSSKWLLIKLGVVSAGGIILTVKK